MVDKAELSRRRSLSNDAAVADAESLCAPCRLCGGKAKITDAGPGCGYYIRCDGINRHRRSLGCMIDDQQLGGWAYNAMDWWNRLHAVSPSHETRGEGL